MPISIPDYNTTPPSDDGSQTEANKVKWSTVTSKIGDPLRDFAQNWHEDSSGSLTTGGTGGAFTVTTTVGYTALTDVPLLVAKANHAATGSDTIDVDSLGPKALNNSDGISLNTVFVFVYDSVADEFNVLAPLGGITTRGDMIRGDSNGDAERLPLGSVRQILSSDGSDVVYRDQVILDTEQSSTSGTFKDFTIPTGAKKATVTLEGVSTDGSNRMLIQLGDSGGIETSGYSNRVIDAATGSSGVDTSGSPISLSQVASGTYSGAADLYLKNSSSNTWVYKSIFSQIGSIVHIASGVKSLSGELTTIRITTTGTPDDFDAGSINIQYE